MDCECSDLIHIDLDDWIKRLANEIESNYPPGPSRDALYDVIKQHTSRYESLKLELFSQAPSALDSHWNEEGELRVDS